MRILLAVALLALCVFLMPASPPPAQAEGTQVISRITPEALATAMTQAGFKAQVATTDKNVKYVTMSIRQGKVTAVVDLNDCNAQGCTFINMWIFGPKNLNADFANQFNSNEWYGVVSILKDGTLMLNMTSNLAGGVTVRHLQEEAGNFDTAVQNLISKLP